MEENNKNNKLAEATFGAGCFWCVEVIFQKLKGVRSVESGYSGGHIKNPAYREVTTGRTGHAEVIRINYDPKEITFEELVEVFFKTHNPTTLNQQGADKGTQYRSAIFYHDEEQKTIAERYKEELDKSDVFDNPIVTEISPLKNFFVAEDYHQNYYNANPEAPYCSYIIDPKLQKFQQEFRDKIRR